MGFDKAIIPKVMNSILHWTTHVLALEAVISVTEAAPFACDVDELQLHDLTAIAGLGGAVNVLVGFSFERSLLDAVYARMTADIDVPAGEEALYLRETAAETVNLILGLSTADLGTLDMAVVLSPPVILEDARSVYRPKKAVFASMRIHTERGFLDVSVVGPRELFDEHLNCSV